MMFTVYLTSNFFRVINYIWQHHWEGLEKLSESIPCGVSEETGSAVMNL